MSQPANQFHLPAPPTASDLDTWDAYLNAWRNYWRALGQLWRTEPEIDANRQEELTQRRAIVADITNGIYPFKGIKLNRADIEWLLATHASGGMYGPVNWDDTRQREREGLDLRGADLSQLNLQNLPLTGLSGGLNRDERRDATAEQQGMAVINLEQADLSLAQLQRATLTRAQLQGADLTESQLQNADLMGAQLQRANLTKAQLQGADLRGANLESTTLDEVILNDAQYGATFLADVSWGNTNIAPVDWQSVKMIGDDRQAQQKKDSHGQIKARQIKLAEYKAAVQANRQLATALRNQGLNEEASHFAYRAQVLQRNVWQLQRNPLRYIFSLLLYLLAGYGYRPLRFVIFYLLVIVGFAGVYYELTQTIKPSLSLAGALVFSITAFHGRGFFPSGFSYDNPVTIVAALEALIGLILEVSFIATFTQRYFSR